MDKIKNFKAIVVNDCNISCILSKENANIQISKGTIVVAYIMDIGAPNSYVITFFETQEEKPITYLINKENLLPIPDILIQFLIAVKNKENRLDVIKNKNVIVSLKPGSRKEIILVIDNVKQISETEILFINEVPELGQGLYFGLKVNGFMNIPEFSQTKFLDKYMKNDLDKSIIISADYFFNPFVINSLQENINSSNNYFLMSAECKHFFGNILNNPNQKQNNEKDNSLLLFDDIVATKSSSNNFRQTDTEINEKINKHLQNIEKFEENIKKEKNEIEILKLQLKNLEINQPIKTTPLFDESVKFPKLVIAEKFQSTSNDNLFNKRSFEQSESSLISKMPFGNGIENPKQNEINKKSNDDSFFTKNSSDKYEQIKNLIEKEKDSSNPMQLYNLWNKDNSENVDLKEKPSLDPKVSGLEFVLEFMENKKDKKIENEIPADVDSFQRFIPSTSQSNNESINIENENFKKLLAGVNNVESKQNSNDLNLNMVPFNLNSNQVNNNFNHIINRPAEINENENLQKLLASAGRNDNKNLTFVNSKETIFNTMNQFSRESSVGSNKNGSESSINIAQNTSNINENLLKEFHEFLKLKQQGTVIESSSNMKEKSVSFEKLDINASLFVPSSNMISVSNLERNIIPQSKHYFTECLESLNSSNKNQEIPDADVDKIRMRYENMNNNLANSNNVLNKKHDIVQEVSNLSEQLSINNVNHFVNSVKETENSKKDNEITKQIKDLESKLNELKQIEASKENEKQKFFSNNNKRNKNYNKKNQKKSNDYEIKRNKYNAFCMNCNIKLTAFKGVLLEDCNHIYCDPCIKKYVETFHSNRIECPFNKKYKCRSLIKESEIRAICELKTIQNEENELENIEGLYRCKTKNCNGVWFCEGTSNIYVCPICNVYNCISCKSLHDSSKTCLPMNFFKKNVSGNKEWKCKTCTAINQEKFDNCQICLLPRNPKEWACENCTFINPNTRNVCNMCGKTQNINKKLRNEYSKLLEIEDTDLYIANSEGFQCQICTDDIVINKGCTIRGCLHQFCLDCINRIVIDSEKAEIKCPLPECENVLQDREIMGIVSNEIYEKHIQRSLREGKKILKNGFQCQTTDCDGFWVYEEGIHSYLCPLCNKENCVPCRAIHVGMNCKEYQDRIFNDTDPNAVETRKKLENMLISREAMRCPSCKIFIIKNGGCHNMYCIMCKKGFVWAPEKYPTGCDYPIKSWNCGICGYKNNSSRIDCFICGRRFKKWMNEINNIIDNNRSNCFICKILLDNKKGIQLKNCKHFYCRSCLRFTIRYSDDEFRCIANEINLCNSIIKESDALSVFDRNEYDKLIIEITKFKMKQMENVYVCNNKNCAGFWLVEENDQCKFFICPLCKESNCRECNVIHTGLTCDQFKDGGYEKYKNSDVLEYNKLIELEEAAFATNIEQFDCSICYDECKPGEGILLRECLHTFCRDCIDGVVSNSETAEIKCPFQNDDYACDKIMQEREIKAIVKEETYKKYLAISLRLGKASINNGYQCKTLDCEGWWINDENINEHQCPLCNIVNCLNCQAIHTGFDCKQYQDRIFNETDPAAIETKKFLENLIKNNEAMHCPKCNVIVARISGCDWIQCAICRCEICWRTKKPRRGPNGCKCREINNKLCHPNCGNCH